MVRQVGEPVFAAPDGTLLLAAQMNDACEEADEDAEFLMKKGCLRAASRPAGRRQIEESAFLSVKNLWGADLYSLMNQYTPIPSVLEKTLPKLTQKKLAAPEPLREKAQRSLNRTSLPDRSAAPSDGGRIRSSD